MAKIKELTKSTKHLLDSGEINLEHRPYLGMSQMGHECERYLWYSFRWYYSSTIPKRVARLFTRGHLEEDKVYDLLRGVGYTIEGEQDGFTDVEGHVRGHCDGKVYNVIEAPKTPHILEIKTMSDKKFKEIQKLRLKKANEVYWAQTQLYMHHSKMTRTLFIAVNKNDDDIYIERIEYNKDDAKQLIDKGRRIVLSPRAPVRAFPTSTFYKCKWCDAANICWRQLTPEKNCRTCIHAVPGHDAQWVCTYNDADASIPLEVQRVGCHHYEANLNTEENS